MTSTDKKVDSATGAIRSADDRLYGVAPAGERLPAAARLGAVRLQVSDAGRSESWYRTVLGLEVIRRDGDVVSLGGVGGTTPLVELEYRPGTRASRPGTRLGLYHFALLLPDRAALGRLVGHLAQLGVRAGASDHLVSEALYLQDPDGHGVEVYADRPRSQWQRRGRELVMATEPLRLQEVLAASGGVPWTGMPAGTTMGHLHLHVAALDEAWAFYGNVLGFDRMVWSYPGALFLAAGGYHHHLGLNTWARSAVQPREDEARLLAWNLVLPAESDARALVERAGAEAPRDPGLPEIHLEVSSTGST
jgi:catechol 2,3-dioxygenase